MTAGPKRPTAADFIVAVPPPAPPSPAAPQRFLSLDATRGFAVMGILLLNIIAFAMPEEAYVNPTAWGGNGVADRLSWFIDFTLFDGKFRGLFSLMFGASALLVMERAEEGGRDGRAAHLNRIFWLFVFGCLHFTLLWWGDILRIYAVLGLVLLMFREHEPLSLVKAAFLCFLIHFAIAVGIVLTGYMFQHQATLPHAAPDAVASWTNMRQGFGAPDAATVGRELALHRGPFAGLAAHQLAKLPGDILNGVMLAGFDTLGFMLIGMAMLKSGFLTGQWPREQYGRTARHCFTIGLPPMIALGIWAWASGFAVLPTFGSFYAWSFPFRIPLVVGYAALFQWLIAAHRDHWAIARVAAAGRAAFSNYLGTSILMAFCFYGWGLGLYGRVARVELIAFVLLAWAIMLLWSKPWLDRFAYGPFEWLWRCLSRRRLEPLLRAKESQ